MEHLPDEEVSDEEEGKVKDDVEFVLCHLKLLCDNNEKVYDYVMKWIAFLFQNAGTINNVALLFNSKEGMGKDAFYKLLKNMIGNGYCGNTIKILRDILGDFNVFLARKILCVINELKGAIGYKYSDDIKFQITNTSADIRKMRTDVNENNGAFVRYIFFTNNDFPIKVTADDRRYLVIQTSQPIPTKDYFDRLWQVIENPLVLKKLFEIWTTIDVSKVDWRNDRPMTEYMTDLRENSRDRELSFLIEKVKSAHNDEEKELKITSKDLLEQFRDDCLQNGYEYKTTPIKFGIKMKKYGIVGFSTKRTKAGSMYIFDIQACIHWLLREKHLPQDYLDLEAEPVRLLGGSKEKTNDVDEDLVTDYSPNNPHLPQM